MHVGIYKNVGYYLMKLVGAVWVAVFLLCELTSSVGPLWIVCVEIAFLMLLH